MLKITTHSNSRKKLRLLIIANVPGPNLNDFYDQLSKDDEIELTVLYCSSKTKKWKEGINASPKYNHKFLWNLNVFSQYARLQINPGVIRYLLFSRADIVQVQGYTSPTFIISLMVLKLFNKPFVFWGEMINRSQSKNIITLMIKKNVVKILNSAKRVYIVGSHGVESYTVLGINKSLIRKLPYSCDLSPFLEISKSRRKLTGNSRNAIVTTSQLIHRKRVDLLINAFISIAEEFPNWDLKIIGTGPLQVELEKLIPEQFKARVFWLGYLEKKYHPAIYKASNIFVLPSQEDGGPMVLPESMASGLPIITTDGVATAKDIIQEGLNGYIIPKNNQKELDLKLRYLITNDKARDRMGLVTATQAVKMDSSRIAKNYAKDLKDI